MDIAVRLVMRFLLVFGLSLAVLAASCSQRGNNKRNRHQPADSAAMAADSLDGRSGLAAGQDVLTAVVAPTILPVVIQKELTYDQHTLADTFPYRDTVRYFQWEKIREKLELLDSLTRLPPSWGLLINYRNVNGVPAVARGHKRNAYKNISDSYGAERYQAAPLYLSPDSLAPERYAPDGTLLRLLSSPDDSLVRVVAPFYGNTVWTVPGKYIKAIGGDSLIFTHAVFVDRHNQNIATLERGEGKWLVRSMNPATTGRHAPPYQKETPLGIFVLQEKKVKMFYYVDGTTEIGGFAPYANRFCNGGYVHGIPVNLPRKEMIEYSASLGTTPRSHMCVRNATSHAKFIFDWAPVEQSLIFVIE